MRVNLKPSQIYSKELVLFYCKTKDFNPGCVWVVLSERGKEISPNYPNTMNPTAFPVSWATSADGQIIFFIARSPRKDLTALSDSLCQSVRACLRAKCVQMYHNILTVAKRVWETITCSWISVLPHHASAFHASHPNIWRMSSLAQGESQRALFPFDFVFFSFWLHPPSWTLCCF